MEELLHYVWKHKIFPLKELQTTAGLPVEVIDPGLQNTNAGPDFFNAKIKIDGTLWVGNVELHQHSSDWMRHRHHSDRAYDSVILHISSVVDCQIKRSNGEPIPQMQMDCPEYIASRYEELREADIYPPCYGIFGKLPKLMIHSWFSSLQNERFAQKCIQLNARLAQCNGNWEDAFFITLARNFGFGLNGEVFEKWASLLPFRAIDKYRDSLFRIETFFFGQAGLLEEESPDEYYRSMQKEYAYLSHVFSLQNTESSAWKFLRLRPGNFPHVRIAQLAYLYYNQRGLFSQVIESTGIKETRNIFSAATSEYWEQHYSFGKESPRRSKHLGNSSLDLLLVNTVVPFLYAYGKYKANDQLCERGQRFLEELKAEDNHITRMWSNAGIQVQNAADSQALIQLKKEYCDKKKCLYCRFGFEYFKTAPYR